MHLNNLKPALGSNLNRRRVGRGMGCGFGKTAGRGHKGQKSRAGGYHKTGFEGGQMPLQRRLPKHGFVSLKRNKTQRIRLSALNQVEEAIIDMQFLKQKGFLSPAVKNAKVYLAGEIDKKLNLQGISVTGGAKAAIEAAGGSVK